ncbi:hypothetical protein LPTSP4_16410 [Leptospira ryugenii]|uniref:Phage tail collar domain-containing protein n=1 Tax=Leptospira ryugenii TaxID=1917863 RepID=A0A2P2DZR8_9LEPT|nr:phage tail protein [Leptospira ryugenii]GBF50117.1 hypothetical protein LPTSP4_16410 [Leptospira ryugenii]
MGEVSITTNFKIGLIRGAGLAVGLMTTSLFAAAAAMKVFSPGDTLSSSAINRNFLIAAPEGAVIAFYLNECPEGWAPADGSNGTPDLRGRFVRGRDNVGTGAAGNDPTGARAIGDVQADAFQGHWHDFFVDSTNLYDLGTSRPGNNDSTVASLGAPQRVRNAITDGTNGTPRTANETRPKNVSLTYCMRKN